MWSWLLLFVFCKQKTAYEMRISDWSSDVCSSDLRQHRVGARLRVHVDRARRHARQSRRHREAEPHRARELVEEFPFLDDVRARRRIEQCGRDRKSVVQGKSVSVRVDLGGLRIIKKKKRRQR